MTDYSERMPYIAEIKKKKWGDCDRQEWCDIKDELVDRIEIAQPILETALNDLRAWHKDRKCESSPCWVCDAGLRVRAVLNVLERSGPKPS
jgi:hypothetical protein